MALNGDIEIQEEYIEEIYNPSLEDLIEARRQLNQPLEAIVETMERKLQQLQNRREENNDHNSTSLIPFTPQVAPWMRVGQFYKMCRASYNTNRPILAGKTFENLMFFFFSGIIAIGATLFIAFFGYQFYQCSNTSKVLMKRVNEMQGERIHLLKVINDFANQNPTFFEMIRNVSDD